MKVSATENSHYPKERVFLLGILIVTAIVYSNTLSNGFISNWDDDGYVFENSLIKHLNWEYLKIYFSTFLKGNYHPLTILTYAIEYKFFGLEPFYYHLTNYILHLLNVSFVFLFIKELTGRIWVAAITSLFFAIHPMHVESVAWISERKDLLFTFFFLLSLRSYIKHNIHKKPFSSYWSFFWFILSLLSKSAAVCLPVLLLLIDYQINSKIGWKNLVSKGHYFALALLFGIIAIISQNSTGAVQNIAPVYGFQDRIFLVSYSAVFYLVKAFFPLNLSSLHFYPVKSDGLLPFEYYLALPAILLIILLVVKTGRFKKDLLFGLLFYLITLLPVLQIIPVGIAIVAERYSYVPYIGVFYIFGQFFIYLKSPAPKTRFVTFASLLIIALSVLYSTLTIERNKTWKSGLILFTDLVNKNPDQSLGWRALGNCRYETNDPEGALEAFNIAVELNKNDFEAYFDRGAYFAETGDFYKAIEDLDISIRLNPENFSSYCNRGLSLMSLKRMNEALSDFNRAIAINPICAEAFYNRGNLYYYSGNLKNASKDYTKAIDVNPDYSDAYFNRGVVRNYLNDPKGSCSDWLIAKQLGNADAIEALRSYCN